MFSSPIVIAILMVLEGSTTSSKDEARQHFNAGRELQTAGKYDQAIAEYEDAYRLAQLPELLFNMAQAYRLKGDRKRAIGLYERYVAAVPEGSTSDEALEHIRTLKLEIEVGEAREASRRALEQAEATRKREEAQAAARLRAIESSTVAERTRLDAAERQTRLEEAHTIGGSRRRFGVFLAVTGIVEVGASIYLGLELKKAAGQYQDNTQPWKSTIDNGGTSTAALDKIHFAQGLAIGEEILVIGGVALAISGTALYVSGAMAESRAVGDANRLALIPLLDRSLAGLTLVQRF
jgi:tetratricopeptide (TPR) repeat protein